MRGPSIFRRVFRLLTHLRPGTGLDEEMAFHLSRITDELIAAGRNPTDARREALRRFGDPEQVRNACGTEGRTTMNMMWVVRMADMVRQDVVFAIRQLVRRPVVSGLSVITLILGVGSTAIVFSVVQAVVLEPLPFPEPDRLVRVSQTSLVQMAGIGWLWWGASLEWATSC